jgi:hypothetical protein
VLVRFLLWITALTVAGVALVSALELPLTPWARSMGLWPTLTGEWNGELRTADGHIHPVYLEIRGGLRNRGRSYIDGRAKICVGTKIHDFNVYGRNDNWRGTRFHLSLSRVSVPGPDQVPDGMQGEWSNDDLRGIGQLVSTSPTATASATRSSAPPPPPLVRYILHRGTETAFLAACGAAGRTPTPDS